MQRLRRPSVARVLKLLEANGFEVAYVGWTPRDATTDAPMFGTKNPAKDAERLHELLASVGVEVGFCRSVDGHGRHEGREDRYVMTLVGEGGGHGVRYDGTVDFVVCEMNSLALVGVTDADLP